MELKKILLILIATTSLFSLKAQNVGVGTTTPTNFFHISPPSGTIDPLRIELLRLYSTERDLMVTDQATGLVKYMPIDDVLSNINPAYLDSLILSVVLNNSDTIYNNQEVRDSILSIVLSQIDVLVTNLLTDTSFINALKDSIDTDIDSVNFANDTLYIYENGTIVSTYLSVGIDSAAVSNILFNNFDSLYTLLTDSILNDLTFLSQLQDSIDTDDQNISGSGLSGTILTIGIQDGASETVDLQGIIDSAIANSPDTDDQFIDVFSLTGTTLNLSLDNDGQPTQTVSLASLQDGTGTDDQVIDVFSLTGTTLNLSLESDGQPTQTVNLASLQDGTGTDDQVIDVFSLTGTTLNLSLESDGQPTQTVNLAALQDGTGTDDQVIDVLSLVGTTLNISLESDGQPNQTLNLAPLLASAGDVTGVTADNGLNVNSGGTGPVPNVRLGGTLAVNTTITQPAALSMVYDLTGTGNFEVRDNGATFLYARNDGRLGIGTTTPTQTLEVNGRIKSNGVNETSDKRYKKDIHTLEHALDNVMKLRGVNYKWRQDEYPAMDFEDGTQLGVIAQEIEKVFPEVVYTDETGYKSVDYSHLVPVLIEAIKELNVSHANEIKVLKEENESIKASLEKNEANIELILKNLQIDAVSNK